VGVDKTVLTSNWLASITNALTLALPVSRHNLIVHLAQKLVYDLLAPIQSNFPFFRQENMKNPVFQAVTLGCQWASSEFSLMCMKEKA
jgi:hypothetical protein